MIACPDCDAVNRLVEIEPHVYIVQVLHDDTCPWLAARRVAS